MRDPKIHKISGMVLHSTTGTPWKRFSNEFFLFPYKNSTTGFRYGYKNAVLKLYRRRAK